MMNFFSNQGMPYIEGSGVGILDLHLISSMVNESILQSIFAGLLLILPVVWLWYVRNTLWRSVILEKGQDIISSLSVEKDLSIKEGRFGPFCMIQTEYEGRVLMIEWSIVLWWEKCVVSFDGVEHFVEEIDTGILQEIVDSHIIDSHVETTQIQS